MTPRSMTVALALAATVSTAAADPTRAPSIAARADAAGHVTLDVQGAGGLERIDAGSAQTPCAETHALPPDEARALVRDVATREDFYPDFVLAVAGQESGFNSVARSRKGAFGLMQLMPETAARFHVDLCDPAGNVLGGVRFLRVLHEKYRNPLFILAAYNAGEAAVEKVHGVPPYPETVGYVAGVLNDFYSWPTPGRPTRANPPAAGATSRSQPELVETPALAKPVSAVAPALAGKRKGDDGFVQHFD